jgi:hypothetical protein
LNENEKAKKILLPHIIENGLASNHELVDITVQFLIKTNNAKEIREQLVSAFTNYKTETEKSKNKEEEYERYYINFLDVKIEIESWEIEFLTEEQQKKDKIMEKCKRSYFYKSLAIY